MIHSRDNDTPVQPQRKQWGLPGHTTPEKLRFSLNLWISTLLIVWRLQELSKIPEKVLYRQYFLLIDAHSAMLCAYIRRKWWRRVDSNHRSETQQIYSLPPLATRELLRIWSW